MHHQIVQPWLAAVCGGILFLLAGCGGGGGDVQGDVLPLADTHGLNAATWTGLAYEHGASPRPYLPIANAPGDTDFSRWATLHDGTTSFLFCFQFGTDTTLYAFGLNPATGAFEFGHAGPSTFEITGTPPSADPSSIAMLHDGLDYRLYMRGVSDSRQIHQFALNTATGAFAFGFRSIPVINTTGVPADASLERWAMLFDGRTYRQYVAKASGADTLYQFGFNPAIGAYEFGFDSIPQLSVEGMPANSALDSFAMLHDGTTYRFFHQAR